MADETARIALENETETFAMANDYCLSIFIVIFLHCNSDFRISGMLTNTLLTQTFINNFNHSL